VATITGFWEDLVIVAYWQWAGWVSSVITGKDVLFGTSITMRNIHGPALQKRILAAIS
jgi:hypothetical protein